MMKRNNLLFLMVTLLLLFAARCGASQGSQNSEEIPENIHSMFVFFNEEKFENNNSIGSLYMKKEGSEIEKITNNALDKAVYENDTEQLLFLNQDSTLFKYIEAEEGPEQIDEDVVDGV